MKKFKNCKNCNDEFLPYNSLQKYCWKRECIQALRKEKEKKEWDKRKRQMEMDLMTSRDYKKLAQEKFNLYIRLRDRNQKCISCNKPLKHGNIDAGHLWSAHGHANITFNEYNVNAQCSRPCNKDRSGDTNNYRINFVKRYSQQILDELDSIAHIEKKWSIDELKEIIEKYKKKIKEIQVLK